MACVYSSFCHEGFKSVFFLLGLYASTLNFKTIIQFCFIYHFYQKGHDVQLTKQDVTETGRSKHAELSRKHIKLLNGRDDLRLARVEIKTIKQTNEQLTDRQQGL